MKYFGSHWFCNLFWFLLPLEWNLSVLQWSLFRSPAKRYLLEIPGKLADQCQLSKLLQGQPHLQPSSTLQKPLPHLQSPHQIQPPWRNQMVLVRLGNRPIPQPEQSWNRWIVLRPFPEVIPRVRNWWTLGIGFIPLSHVISFQLEWCFALPRKDTTHSTYRWVPLKPDFLGALKSVWLKSNPAYPVIFSLVYL